jgi:hypothetical protein
MPSGDKARQEGLKELNWLVRDLEAKKGLFRAALEISALVGHQGLLRQRRRRIFIPSRETLTACWTFHNFFIMVAYALGNAKRAVGVIS